MQKLRVLQIKKLIKELDYIESNYEYINEIVREADMTFLERINSFLDEYPDVKKIYDNKFNNHLDKLIKEKNEEVSIIETDIDYEQKSTDIKKLYREIAKLTHPDLIDNKNLNDFYVEATNYYNDNNKIGIYKISDQLNIEYDLNEDDESFIKNKIENFKNKITFLESTFTWKWFNCEDDNIKETMIVDFIKTKI